MPTNGLIHALNHFVKLRMDLSMGYCSKSFQIAEELLLARKRS